MLVTAALALVALLTAFVVVYFVFLRDRGGLLDRALELAARGAYVDARAIVRPRIDRDPEDVQAHYVMSRIYAQEGNAHQELEHLREIRRIGRFSGVSFKPADILARIGQLYYEDDRFSEAFESYLESLNYDANNETALAHIAFMAIGQGEFQVADGFFRRLVRVAPNVADYRIARGVCLTMLRSRDAAEEFQLAISIAPKNHTAQFLYALHLFRESQYDKSRETIERLLPSVTDELVEYIVGRLAAAAYYMSGEYQKALTHAERCLATALKQGWEREEYDARLTVAYMAILNSDLEKANEHLLELEIRNPQDDTVMKVSDFRMDLEEQVAEVDRISPRGFDFRAHMQDWVRNRFADDAIYRLSGLEQEQEFDVLSFFTREGQMKPRAERKQELDPDVLIERFNNLKGDSFLQAAQSIMANLGFKMERDLNYRDKDGADYIAFSLADRKVKALFRIRQWRNQPISDIFLRDQQNYMNELKVSLGFVVAGARLTAGAETASANLKKITIVNDMAFAEILQRILQ